MAKVIFHDPEEFRNTVLGGDYIFQSGDKIITRQIQSSAYTITNRLYRGQGIFSQVAVYYQDMTDQMKLAWIEYMDYFHGNRSGYNYFIKNNIQRDYPPGLNFVNIPNISVPPEFPTLPVCFAAYYCLDIDRVVFEWLDNYEEETYIIGAYKRITSKNASIKFTGGIPIPSKWSGFRIVLGDLASLEEFYLPNDLLIYSSKIQVTIRSCNERGEVSPWCDPITIELPDPPDPDFSATPRSGDAPLMVIFDNLTEGSVSKYLWNFGDGTSSDLAYPVHIYDGPEALYSVKLTAWGCGNVKRTKTRHNYISTEESAFFDNKIFISDSGNSRIVKRKLPSFSYDTKIGSFGSGDDEFNEPTGLCADDTHVFICDWRNYRIVKRLKSDLSYVDQIGSAGSGNDQFGDIYGIACDEERLYICDLGNRRIHVRYKSDLSLIALLYGSLSGDGKWNAPHGIAVDSWNIYFSDVWFQSVIVYDKSTLLYSKRYDPGQSGAWALHVPLDVIVDSYFFWVLNSTSPCFSIDKIDKFNLIPVAKLQTDIPKSWPGLLGLTCNSSFIFVCDRDFHVIKKYDRGTLQFVAVYGGYGSGDDEFNLPQGLAIQGPFTIV